MNSKRNAGAATSTPNAGACAHRHADAATISHADAVPTAPTAPTATTAPTNTADAGTTALSIRGVHKTFGAVHAVAGVDLDILRGQIVALLGPNGAGKTTLLDMVLGLTSPTQGSIQVLGETPHQAVVNGKISAMLQTGGLLRDLTVRETVNLIASTYRRSLDPDDVMRRTGLEPLARRAVAKCSGGEQQRLRFALALLCDPQVMILDEPTAAMDVNARRDFWATMRQEAREGRTIIFATHYLQEADEFAERIVLMAAGRIVADGTVAEIRAIAGAKRVSVYWPQATNADIAAVPGVNRATRMPECVEFEANDADATARYLLTKTPATGLEIVAASLDDAFAALTATGAPASSAR